MNKENIMEEWNEMFLIDGYVYNISYEETNWPLRETPSQKGTLEEKSTNYI